METPDIQDDLVKNAFQEIEGLKMKRSVPPESISVQKTTSKNSTNKADCEPAELTLSAAALL